jgi:lipid A 4'-phosphatase
MTLQVQVSGFEGRNREKPSYDYVLPRWLADRLLLVISGYFVILNLVLFLYPTIDTAVSSLAFNGDKFVFAKNASIKFLREVHKDFLRCILPLTLLLLALYAIWPRPLRTLAPHRALFVLASFGIGSLVVVHALKLLVGRARPHDILLFGGDKEFTPVWQMVDMCGASCSFPSGEAAAAAALLSFIVYFSPGNRWAFLAMVFPLAVFLSANRVLVGAHFFSDVVLAGLIVFFVTVTLWRYIEPRADVIDARVRRAGEGARRLIYGSDGA